MFRQFAAEAKAIVEECISISYYMRGALTYEEAMRRTFTERELISDFLKERLEAESKKQFPNY